MRAHGFDGPLHCRSVKLIDQPRRCPKCRVRISNFLIQLFGLSGRGSKVWLEVWSEGEDKKAAIDPGAIALRFLLETAPYVGCIDIERASTSGRLDHGNCSGQPVRLVKRNQLGDIGASNAIPIGKAKRPIANMLVHATYAAVGHRRITPYRLA